MNMHAAIEDPLWCQLDTPEKIKAIISIYDGDHNTGATIANGLSRKFNCHVTRSSVIGMYDRHRSKGLDAYPLKGKNPNIGGSLRNMNIGKPKVVKVRIRPKVVKPAKVKPEEEARSLAPEPFLKFLIDMEARECRWPVDGDRAMTRFCCHEAVKGRPYCTFHHDLSRGAGTPSERAAHRLSKGNIAT